MHKLFYISFLWLLFFSARSQCLGPQSYNLSPAGPYSPGQVVTVEYTLSSFVQYNLNWIIAFDLDLGPGWINPTSIVNPANSNTNSSAGTGYWQWDNQNTYPSGLNFGPGWRFINTAGNNNWGSSSTGPFVMTFQVTVGPSCDPDDLSIDMSVIGDCQTGGWSNGDCCPIVPYSIYSGSIVSAGYSLNPTINDISCNGFSDGAIDLNISGGSPPYTYVWSNNSTGSSLTNLSPGTYSVTVTDNLNCIENLNNLIVDEPLPISASVSTINVSCYGSNDGNATILSNNNINSYIWSDGQITQTATGLSPGSYSFTIIDVDNCTYSDTITIFEPPPLNLSLFVFNESCPGASDGSILVDVQGSSTPPGNISNLTYCQSSSNTSDFPGNLDAIIEEVVLIGDANNIINNTSGVVDYYEDYTTTMFADLTEGQSYTIDLVLGDLSQGSYPTGAKVYIDFNIDGDFNDVGEEVGVLNNNGSSPNIGSINFIVPTTGFYGPSRMRVVSQDAFMYPTSSIGPCDFADPNVINATPWFGATEDYSIVLNNSNLNLTYLWNNGTNSDSIFNLSAGLYSITVSDQNGCSVSDTANVNTNSSNISVSAGVDQIICNGGTPNSLLASSISNGSYSWSPSNLLANPNTQNPNFISSLNTTTIFSVNLTDINGCIATDSVTVYVNPSPTASINANPNPACLGDDIQLSASTNIPVNRYRFQYNNGNGWQNIISINNGGWGTSSTEYYNNIITNTQFRVRVREDWGCAVSPWSTIVNVPINFVSTPFISHN